MYALADLIGVSSLAQQLKEQIRLAARGSGTVLVLGETGTGKELVAHALHGASPRAGGPLVAVNCGAIPAELAEAELFGYAEGAFTGARRGGHRGLVAQAHGGTLFLDEVGELPLQLQAKLLRVLQEKEIQPVGGCGSQRVDLRVIAASNRDLGSMVAEGRFRADLYYRLNVVTLRIPALRERPEDILPLAHHFLARVAADLGVQQPALRPETMGALLEYGWPGNVRELANAMTRALYLGAGDWVEPGHLPEEVTAGACRVGGSGGRLRSAVRSAERQAILAALRSSGGNKSRAARILGMSRSRLYEKLADVGIHW